MARKTYLKIGIPVLAASLLEPALGLGQGCVCQRQGSPFIGGINPYMGKGEAQLTLYYRGYESTEHFQGRNPLPELDPNGPNNRQNYFTTPLTPGRGSGVSRSGGWASGGGPEARVP